MFAQRGQTWLGKEFGEVDGAADGALRCGQGNQFLSEQRRVLRLSRIDHLAGQPVSLVEVVGRLAPEV